MFGPTVAGIFIGGGFLIFIDGAVTAPDSFPIAHIIPLICIIFSVFALNIVSPKQIQQNSFTKMWFFGWMSVAMMVVLYATYKSSVEYPTGYNWPGVSVAVSAMFIFVGGMSYYGWRHSNSNTLLNY